MLHGAVNQSDEAMLALISLGYSEQEAFSLLKLIDPDLPVDERLNLALKGANK